MDQLTGQKRDIQQGDTDHVEDDKCYKKRRQMAVPERNQLTVDNHLPLDIYPTQIR